MERQLIFVYNANKDPISAIVDYAHKVFKPSTYACELCALTHHHFGERNAWKDFQERTNAEMEFMYIRGFEEKFNLTFIYPVILEREGDRFVELIGKQKLHQMTSVDDLIEVLDQILDEKE